ncbi:MAG: competence/damage-inducible protein A [Bryobacteraceae bacterium]|jgi:nicotinamide-nucleotide amidase
MNAEIIAVGSELLTPQRIDTNSLWLTDQLNSLGVEVTTKTIVGDDRERLAIAVRAACARSDVVILTGGLGPTEDDVTRDAVAGALRRTQVFRQNICDAIERRFRRTNRAMAEINKRQAFVIEGAEALPNPNGTAPGQWIQDGARAIMLLPGPPNELKPMFTRECLPRLQALLPPQVIRTQSYRIALMPESEVDQRIAPVYTKYKNPVTTILAAAGDIQIHLRARCSTAAEAESLLAEVGPLIEAILGDSIYAKNLDPLEVVVGKALRARSQTLSVAESCTGGLVAERITSVPGASDYFLGGFLTYTDRIKTELLGVPADLLREHTAVSEPVAEALARGARERTGSTWALSVTGVAGPTGGTEATPLGTVIVGLAGPDACSTRRARFLGDRDRVRALAAQLALDVLRRELATPR